MIAFNIFEIIYKREFKADPGRLMIPVSRGTEKDLFQKLDTKNK